MKTQSKLLSAAKFLNDRLLGIETFVMALITVGLVAAIFIEVVCRYFLFVSVAWAEELTRYLFIWLTYIGSAYAVYTGSHTEIDVLQQIFTNMKGKKKENCLFTLKLLSIISTGAFLSVFAKVFFDYMMIIWARTQTSPTMHIPMGLVYLPVFIGTVMAVLHCVYLLIECLHNKHAGVETVCDQD